MSPTIKDVAKLANVSIATVSRVLNNLDGFSTKTKEKVESAIAELGYKPNAMARGLVNKKSRTIGVLHPSMHGRYIVDLLRGIDTFTHEQNYSVIICNTDNSGSRTMEYIKLLGEKQVEGIIFASAKMTNEYEEALLNLNIPIVLVSTSSITGKIPSINIDNYKAAYDATIHLIEKGHTQIAMIGGEDLNDEAGEPREAGFRKALQDNNLSLNETSFYGGDFSFESGIKGTEILKNNNPKITAIFAASDLIALGVLNYAYNKRLIIPHELAVIGFDDNEDAKMAIPPLTTIHQPTELMGREAAKMVLSSERQTKDMLMNHKIIIRKTT